LNTARGAVFNGGVKARSPGHWCILAVAGAALAGFMVFGLLVPPAEAGYGTHEKLGLPPCTLMAVTGVPCPGCGVTTSVAMASRGRFVDAFRNQPFGLLVAALGVISIPWAVWGHATGRDLWRDFLRLATKPVVLSFVAALLAAWVYKLWLVLGS
jgi:hypothetical protein